MILWIVRENRKRTFIKENKLNKVEFSQPKKKKKIAEEEVGKLYGYW